MIAPAFDSHHPPPTDIIDKCVHCGFCLTSCPTYVLWGKEMDSPRGRIDLMKAAGTGEAAMTAVWVHHFDTCLGCMACTTACPSGVDYGKLIEATRAQIERRYKRPSLDKLYRRLLFGVLTSPSRLRLLRGLLLVYQRSGVQALIRRVGAMNILPRRLQALDALTPTLAPRESVPPVTPAAGERERRVGLVTGCVQSVFLSPINAATARLLAAEGCEVVAPAGQPCCGALLMHAGEESRALACARRMIETFETANVETIVSNAGGCGSNLKEYGYQLRDDPAYAERAARFSATCRDVAELLAEIRPKGARHSLPLRVAYHESCHLQHAQGVRTQPRHLLSQIPGVQLLEIPEGAICCGSAGIYNLVQPSTAADLGRRKAELIAALRPDVVATGNPGCVLQIQSALAAMGERIPVMHTIQLLDASMRARS